MKIRNIVILAIRSAGPELREKLMKAMGITSLNTYYRHLKDNHSSLTKAATLQVIREEFDLSDSEILEVEPEEIRA